MQNNIVAKSISEIYAESEHEKVVLWSDPASHYRGIVAIHSTALGPAVGGTRFYNYGCDKVASIDALRLSRAMSYKNALAGLPFGGGKAVILAGNQETDREKLFRAHGKFINSLKGEFITGEDVGTRPSDMEYVRQETEFVAGLPGRSGDPAPMTAYGVFRAMQACAQHRWQSAELDQRRIVIQGCGATGYHLARELSQTGATLIVSDLDKTKAGRLVDEFGASEVSPADVFEVDADILAPCALGGVLNDETVQRLRVEVVVGSANNQLQDERHGDLLAAKQILFAPDYVANAGGVISGCRELLGWSDTDAKTRVSETYERMLGILEVANRESTPPHRVAKRLAMKLLYRGGDKRREH